MPYRLMLVDDEPEIRDGMKEIIDWEACGFCLVAEADNGLDALQLAEQTRPDLIITDVRMHFMNGLEMVEKIRAFLPMAQFIVVSGYDEFEYARKSIQIRISDYVLKPISAAEFQTVLARAKQTLDEEHTKRNSVKIMNQIFAESLPILREQLLCSIMSGGMDELSVRAAAARYGLNLEASRYAVAVLHIAPDKTSDLMSDEELTRLAVERIVREVMAERVFCHVFNYNGHVAVLTLVPETRSMSEILGFLDAASAVVRDYLGVQIVVGVGEMCDQLSEISGSVAQAMAALNHWAFMEDSTVIYIRDVKPRTKAKLVADPFVLSTLSNALKARNRPEITRCVRDVMNRIRNGQVAFLEYQLYMLDVLMMIVHTAQDMQVELDMSRGMAGGVIRFFMEAHGIDETESVINDLCDEIVESIGVGRKESGKRIALQATEYIARCYAEQSLTLERVCEHLNISPPYFRALFKRKTGQTFHQYLTNLRMNKAMELLKGTNLKTAEIAQKVGLGEASYFSYSFKKHYGISPSQIRKELE